MHMPRVLTPFVFFVERSVQVNIVHAVNEMEQQQIAIQKAYIVSCVNSREQDIAAAADVVRGKSVAPGVELYIAAGA
jgi:homoaconitate hydratase